MDAKEFPTAEIAQWVDAWRQTRALTYDLLRALPYPVMNFSPHPEFGTLVRQIRHAADIEAPYLAPIRTGTMAFAAPPPQRSLHQSKESLYRKLRHVDAKLVPPFQSLTP